MSHVESILSFLEQHQQRDQPYVTLSYAQSLDGCVATDRASPLDLSGNESQVLSHQLRAHHDAVLVGIGTVLADDPHLNVRKVKGKDPQPVILDSHLRFPADARSMMNERKPWIFTTDNADQERKTQLEVMGAYVLRAKMNEDNQVDLHYAIRELGYLGIKSVLVEGGAQIITNFLSARLIDAFVIFITPAVVGGLHAIERPLSRDLREPGNIKCFPQMDISGQTYCGKDLVLWGSVKQ